MAGTKAPEKEELPPHEAGRQVLDYVNQQEKEADEAFAAAHGVSQESNDEDEKPLPGKGLQGAEASQEASEKVSEKEEPEIPDAADNELEGLTNSNAELRIKSARTKMFDSNARAKTAEGELVTMRLENEDLLRRLQAKAIDEPGTPSEDKEVEKPKIEATDLQKSLDELEAEYPEIAAPMLKMMARQDAENKRLTEQVSQLALKDEARAENGHVDAIAEAHPDYQEIASEPLLDDWIKSLPAVQRTGAAQIRKNGSTEDVIELLTMFKQANNYDQVPSKKDNSKLEKAKKAGNPSFNKSKQVNLKDGEVVFTRQQISLMSQEEYNENEKAIDDAMAKGLIQ